MAFAPNDSSRGRSASGFDSEKGYALLASQVQKKLQERLAQRVEKNIALLVGSKQKADYLLEQMTRLNQQLEIGMLSNNQWYSGVKHIAASTFPQDSRAKKLLWAFVYWCAPHSSAGIEAIIRKHCGLLKADKEWLLSSELEAIKPRKTDN